MKLLHIDDNRKILAPFEFYFEMYDNIDYTSCDDPEKGIELIKQGNFDAVLLDLAMPKMSGYEIVDKLNQSGEIKNQNIIVFSATNPDTGEIEELEKKGIHSYVQKTTPISDIINHLENTIGVVNVRSK